MFFSPSVVSDSLWPHGQHARLPCPSPSHRTCSNSGPLSRWCHLTISSSVVPFSSCLQSLPASGTFLMSQLFTLGGQSTGASVSASDLPMNIQSWFPLGLTGLVYLQSKGLSRASSKPKFNSISFSALSIPYGPTFTSIHDYWKNHSFDYISKVMSLLFNMLSRFIIAFLLRGKGHDLSILRIGLKKMEAKGLWNWRLTTPKTIKMTLVTLPMTNLKMTSRADMLFLHVATSPSPPTTTSV